MCQVQVARAGAERIAQSLRQISGSMCAKILRKGVRTSSSTPTSRDLIRITMLKRGQYPTRMAQGLSTDENTRLRTQCMIPYTLAFTILSVVTWSVSAEPGSGGIQRHARNRLTQIQPWFRRSPMWGFWSLNRLLYSTLFFKNLVRRKAGIKTASSANDPDAFTRHFGTAQPSSIPECTSATNTPCACVATHRFFFK